MGKLINSHRSASLKSRKLTRKKSRVASVEALEARQLLVAAIWNNVSLPVNVSGDSSAVVSPLDALLVINELTSPRYRDETGALPKQADKPSSGPYLDVSCDGQVSPLDALLVINQLNKRGISQSSQVVQSTHPGVGIYAAAACSPQLLEGDRLTEQLSTELTVPYNNAALMVVFQTPQFDSSSPLDTVRDAFEVVVQTADQQLILPYKAAGAATYNWSEGSSPSYAGEVHVSAGQTAGDSEILIPLVGLVAGEKFRVTTRLINNDSDNNSSVLFRGVEFKQLGAPVQTVVLSEPTVARVNFDTDVLDMLSADVVVEYGRTSFDAITNELVAEIAIRNNSEQAIVGRLVVAIDAVDPSLAEIIDPDGELPDGRAFIDLTAELNGRPLIKGMLTSTRVVRFRSVANERFTMALAPYGLTSNVLGVFDSTPNSEVRAGDKFDYTAHIADSDRAFSFSLIVGQSDMHIDSATGELTWQTDAEDAGTVSVIIRAQDVEGDYADQVFTLTVISAASTGEAPLAMEADGHDYPTDVNLSVATVTTAMTSSHGGGSNGGGQTIGGPGVFFYSVSSAGYIYNSDRSRFYVDDSDIVKLTVLADKTWHHEIYFDGSDVGLTTSGEDIDAFAIRADGSIIISTEGYASVSGVSNVSGEDLLRFIPTSTGATTRGSWQLLVDGSDVGLSCWENISGVSELADGRLVISTSRTTYLPGISRSVKDKDLVALSLTSTGKNTAGSWNFYLDGSDIGLASDHEEIDGVSVEPNGTTIHLSTVGNVRVSPNLVGYGRDILTFEATLLGTTTRGVFRPSLTMNGSETGLLYHWIDAIHVTPASNPNPLPPTISTIGNRTVYELTQLALQLTATDPDSAQSALIWSISSGPVGLTINPQSGLLTWTPSEADGPGSYPVTVSVSDGALSDTESFTISVNEVNLAPVMPAIPIQRVDEQALFQYQVVASDLDLPSNTLTFSFLGEVPSGMSIDSNGLVTWTPNESQGPNTYAVTVRATDNGTPARFASRKLNVVVGEVNRAPQIQPIANINAASGVPVQFTVSAIDADLPVNNLIYSFDEAPVGATIHPSTGAFNWTTTGSGVVRVIVRVTDNGTPALFDTESFTITLASCLFGAEAYTFGESGGSTNPGSGSISGCDVLLVEGDSFEVNASVDITIPAESSHFVFRYSDLNFDNADNSGVVNDAFEVAIVDAAGYSLVHAVEPGRDAYFNVSEQALTQAGVNAQVAGNEVKLDLSHIPAGTVATIIFRLVNNDADQTTGVRITPVSITPGALGTPSGLVPPAIEENSVVNLNAFSDVTPSMAVHYGNSSYNAAIGSYFANYSLQNLANYAIDGPFVVIVKNISSAAVAIVAPDGFTTTGEPYYIVNGSEVSADGNLAAGAASSNNVFEFRNATGTQFSYALQILASPNAAPEIVSTPIILVEAGRPYAYASRAVDPNASDTLTYELPVAPSGMSIDPVTGLINWSTQTASSGNNLVRIKVNDGRGGTDEQAFAVEVRTVVPNRPPVIISTPEVTAYVASATYQYSVNAIDADGDAITYSLDVAPVGMSIIPTTGWIIWHPTSSQLGLHTVRVIANDGRGGTATQEYQMRVLQDAENNAPVIVSDPVESLFVPGFSNPASGTVSPQRISLDLGNGQSFDGTVSITLPDDAARFADIVLAVDESSSMGGDQAWVAGMIPLLDTALKAQGIGSDTAHPNRFAVIGFGGGRDGITVGHFLNQEQPTKYTLYGPNNTVVASGLYNEVVPEELLNLALPDDGRYVLVVEAANPADLAAGIDIGIEGKLSEGIRQESLILGALVNDRLSPGQPVQYSFSLTTPTLLYFDSLEKDPRIQWTLRGPSGTLGNSIDFDSSDVSLASPVYAAAAGAYTLTIDSNVDVAADYRFRVLDLSTAPQITSGELVAGEFTEKDETFAYRLQVPPGQQFEFVNTITAAHDGSKWRLIGPEGNVVTLPGHVPSRLLGINQPKFKLATGGEYYLLMEAAQSPKEGNSALRVPSRFTFTVTIADPIPPTPLALGDSVNGVIAYVGDFVVYSFSLAERTNFYLDSLVDSAMTWTLAGPAGTRSAIRFDQTDSFNSSDPVLDLVSGDYQLQVNSNGLQGFFAFRPFDLDTANVITPGTTFGGELTKPSETDFYKFNASAGNEFYIDVVTASDAINTEYKIYNAYGLKIFESNGHTDTSSIKIPVSGAYYLLVEGWRGNAGLDTYSMNVVPIVTSTLPLSLGTAVNAAITTPGQKFVYTFVLASDRQLYFDALTNNANLVWSLDGPTGNIITSLGFTQSDSNDRVDASIDARAGNYRLTVNALADNLGNFGFAVLDLFNPAHSTAVTPSPGIANPAVTMTPTSGVLANQTEVFRFNAVAGDVFSFVTTVVGTTQSYYRILDSNAIEVIPRTAIVTDQLNKVFSKGGTYYLLVEGRIIDTVVDNWSMAMNYVQNNGPTTFGGSPLVLGTATSGNLSVAAQVDLYKFSVPTRGNYYFDSQTNVGTIRWDLLGPTGTLVLNRLFTASDAQNQSKVAFDLIPGDYQIQIDATSGTPGAYNFKFVALGAATPIAFGTAFGGNLTPPNETDLYKFNVVAGEKFYFSVEAASDVDNSVYRVIDPFGQTVFTADDLRNFGPTTLDFTGAYTLLVEGGRANTGIDTYSLNVHKIPVAAETPLVFGATITNSFNTLGQSAVYTFSIADYTHIHFDSLTNSAVYNWTLTNAFSTIVNARRFDQSDSSNVTQSVIELPPGEYRLTVAGLGETQPYSFRLLDISSATAIALDTPITSIHANTKSTQVFDFMVDAGDTLLFDAQGATGFSTSATWRLIDPYGSEVFEQALATDSGLLTLEHGGRYRILVEGRFSDTGSNGQFVFEVVDLGNSLVPVAPTALILGTVVNGSISKRFETDRFAFTLNENTLAYFDSLTNDATLTWTLENAARTLVTGRLFDSSDSSTNAAPVLSLKAGEYTLSVTSSEIEPYSFSLQGLSLAVPVVLGTPFTAELNPGRQSDIYAFTANANEPIYLNVVTTSSAGSAFVRVVDQFGAVVKQQTSLADIETFTLPVTGTYTLLVEGLRTVTAPVSYEINLIPASRLPVPLVVGETQAGSIAGIGDVVEYSFNLPGNANLYFDSLSNTPTTTWTLEGPAGVVVSNRRFDLSDSFNFETPLLMSLPAGDYKLTVDGTGEAVGNFSFRMLDVAANATPITLDSSFSDTLSIPSQTNVYQFDAILGQEILIDFIAASDTNNSLYRIFDPLGNEVFELRNLLDADLNALQWTGSYTLIVEGSRANTGLDTYEFAIRSRNTRSESLTLGSVVADTLAIGEEVEYSVIIPNVMFVVFDSLTNASRLTWSIAGPTGQVILNRTFNFFLTTTSAFELRAGTYVLSVDGATDFSGVLGFSLMDIATATPLTPGTPIVGTLNPADESQLFKFNAVAGDNYSFDVISATNNLGAYRLIDPFGRVVFSQTINVDRLNVALTMTGSYTLQVEGRFDATVPNAYQLNVLFNSNTPPPALVGSTLVLGATQSGNLSTAAQIDSYRFTLTDRSLLHMDAFTNSSTVRWSLRGPRGVEVTNLAFTTTDSFGSTTSYLNLFPGNYQLEISASSGVPGAYAFALRDFDDAIPVTPGALFPGVPADTIGVETDLYRFSALAGERYVIDIVSTGAVNDAEFKLIDQYGTVIKTSVSGMRDLDQVVMPHNGVYTLLVEGRVSNAVPDQYSVNIVPILTTSSILAPGVSTVASLTKGQERAYTFSIASPSLFLFSPQTNSSLVQWSLVGDRIASIVTSREFDDGVFSLDLPIGNYSLTVDGVNDYASAANFTVLVADNASVLVNDAIANTQLSMPNAAKVYQFNGLAGQHFALLPDYNLQFGDSARAAVTAGRFVEGADPEDGWSGIDVAVRANVFRDGAAINYIVVTDEDRDIQDDNLDFAQMFGNLTAQSALLNMVVANTLRDSTNAQVIGVDSNGVAYKADGSGGFTTSSGGFAVNPQISVKQDYIDLAWALDGAVWDLNLLRGGGLNAVSFTNAFIDVKVAEILEQTSLKLISANPTADFQVITPLSGQYDTITGGQTYDFDIHVGNNGRPMSYDLLFKQGQTIGSIPVYIISPYEYGAVAVDSDGDTLTWSLVNGPAGLAIDPGTGVLAWGVESVVYGMHDITIRVEDGRGGFDEQTFVLDINGGEAASLSGRVFNELTSTEQIYLNDQNITVSLGASMSAEPFVNNTTANSLANIIDAPTADSPEDHDQLTHVWVSGEPLEIEFDFGRDYDLKELHFWNYFTEQYDVDEIRFQFFDRRHSLVDTQTLFPRLGNNGGTNPILPERVLLDFNENVRYVNAVLTGTNGQVDFNNLGFTALVPNRVDLPGHTIFLDENRNGILDTNEVSAVTDANGEYEFAYLEPGSYTVVQQPQPGWEQIRPTGPYELTVAPGEDQPAINFANREVSIVNTDPIINGDPRLSIVAGEDYTYAPIIQEIDGDQLSFDLPLAPAGMAVNFSNGTVRWTPSLNQVGSQNVLLRVRDGRGGFDLQYFTIEVAKPNTAPLIISTPPAGPAGVGLPLVYDVNAIDADGDSLAFTFSSAPIGATIGAATGIIQWTPTPGQLGTQSFTVSVNDGRGFTAEQAFVLAVQVNPANTDPIFLSEPPVEVRLGDVYLYRPEVLDANGDPLGISLAAAPAGMLLVDNLISWTPGPNQLGNQTVRILANDGRGGIVSQEYTIRVSTQPINNPPTITSVPIISAVANIAYQFLPTANDADSDNLFWSLEEGPAGMSMDPVTGRVDWLPTIDDLGPNVVTIQVIDTHGSGVQRTFTLTVRAVNTPPIILSMPRTDAAVGATYLYQVTAQDVDQDRLTFSFANAPGGMTIDANTGRIVWTPIAGQAGSQNVSVLVRDSAGAIVTQTYSIAVAAGQPNQLPVITSSANFYATVDAVYSYDVDAIDPDGDAITYSLLNSPAGMNINANSGLITWTPGSVFVDPVLVEVLAQDQSGGGSLQGFGIRVQAANNAPVITSTPPTTLAPGQSFRYDILATDADGDFLTYQLVTGPTGMLIDGVGRMFWIPTADQIGSNAVEVRVTDTRGATATQAFSLTVGADITAPQVAILLSRNPVNIGAQVDIRVSAVDNVGVNSIVLTVGGVAVPLDSRGIARVQMNTLGSVTASAIVTDAAGNSTTKQIEIFVSDPNDVNGPTLLITSPVDGGAITAPTNVIGSVTDATLVSYRLLLAEFGSSNFKVIGSGTQNVNNGVLGKIDPTLLQNGSYVLRLEAFDAGGRGNVFEQAVEITGQLKLGNFQLSFTDVVIPIEGIPIEISRVYDSLNANQIGSFGYGWQLNFRDTQLTVSLEKSGLENIGIYSAFREGVRVYLNVPGLGRQGFTFEPEIRVLPGFGNSLVLAKPRFIPDPGVTSSLSVGSGGSLLVNEFGELYAAGGIPYNPASADFGGKYKLTTQEGVVFEINGRTGLLESFRDQLGHQVDYTEAGLISSAGVSITFERDAQGRVTRITDPAGKSISYAYSPSGDLKSVTDREGNSTSYTYSSEFAHYLESIQDPLGRIGTRSEYDEFGRIVAVINSQGNRIELSTNAGSYSQIIKDALGQETVLVFDTLGNIVSTTNALNQTTSRTFDSRNNLTSEVDGLGHVTSFSYDRFGNLLTATDPDGLVTRSTFDSSGNLLSQTDALGNTTLLRYSNGRVTSLELPTGERTQVTYSANGFIDSIDGVIRVQSSTRNSRGYLTEQISEDGTQFYFTYDALGNRTTETRIVGGTAAVTSYAYDSEGRQIAVVDALGRSQTYQYDAAGNLVAVVDAKGRRTGFIYDSRDLLIESILPDETEGSNADNPRIHAEYDANGRKVADIDAMGRRTEYVYDVVGQLTQTIFPDATPATIADNPRISTEYDVIGRPVAEIDERGNRTEFAYDNVGNLTTIRDALGNLISFNYDGAGKRITQSDALGNTISFVYDDTGRVSKTVLPDGSTTTTMYDQTGRPYRQTDALGNSKALSFDTSGRLGSVVDALGGMTTYLYDEFGSQVSQQDANGRITSYVNDLLGRRIGTQLPSGQVSLSSFDGVGNLASTTSFNGTTINYEYDSRDRLVRKVVPAESTVQYSYDLVGNLLSTSDSHGTTTFEYDERNQLIAQTNPDGTELVYTYDLARNRTSVTSPSGTTVYSYDVLNRLTLVNDPDGNNTTYTYDASGNLVLTQLPNGTQEARQYDAARRVVLLENTNGASLINSFAYTYDAAGRRTSAVEADGRRVDYFYDSVGRLIQERITGSNSSVQTIRYTYDAASNRLTKTDSVSGVTSYTYDGNDLLVAETLNGISTSYIYDSNGNTLSKTVDGTLATAYTWNAENKLVAADVDGDGTVDVEYEYDAFGNQVSRKTSADEVKFLVDRNLPYAQVIEEYSAGGIIKVSYVFGLQRISENRSGSLSYYYRDVLGSTRAILDSSGLINATYDFDAFGNLLQSSGASPNTFLFTGEYRDSLTGLDYLRARHLNTSLGRFISRDAFPAEISNPLTLHRYMYANANPVSFVDPSGEIGTLLETLKSLAIRGYNYFNSVNSARKAFEKTQTVYDILAVGVFSGLFMAAYGKFQRPSIEFGPAGLIGGARAGLTIAVPLSGKYDVIKLAATFFVTQQKESQLQFTASHKGGTSFSATINLTNIRRSTVSAGGRILSIIPQKYKELFSAEFVYRISGGLAAFADPTNIRNYSGVIRLDVAALSTFKYEWNLIEVPYQEPI